MEALRQCDTRSDAGRARAVQLLAEALRGASDVAARSQAVELARSKLIGTDAGAEAAYRPRQPASSFADAICAFTGGPRCAAPGPAPRLSPVATFSSLLAPSPQTVRSSCGRLRSMASACLI